jgi:hypothetical protein
MSSYLVEALITPARFDHLFYAITKPNDENGPRSRKRRPKSMTGIRRSTRWPRADYFCGEKWIPFGQWQRSSTPWRT